jgi:predicted dehydrogenase/threonine dehydrogenase-like Zn-dependent dehydrogenase
MKQVVQDLRNGDTKVIEVPAPKVKPGMYLVRTGFSLVSSGTERMLVDFAEKSLIGKARSRPDILKQVIDKARKEGILTTFDAAMNRLDQPIVLGYSSAGVVVDSDLNQPGIQPGQAVACAGGGYAVHAEYALVPKNLTVPVPDTVDLESAAFTTLGAIALHGFRLTQAQLGESILVIGLGLIGMMAVQIARAAGCRVMGVDLDNTRIEVAQGMGIHALGRPDIEEGGNAFTQGLGFDQVLICADTRSSDPVELAGEMARDRANVVAVGAVGLNLPRKIYYEKELIFVNSRSYGPGRYDINYEERGHDYPSGYVRWTEQRNMEAFLEMLAGGQVVVKPLITHRFPVHDAGSAYEVITGKTKDRFLGVLLTYPNEDPSLDLPMQDTVVHVVKTAVEQKKHAAKGVETVKLGVLGAGNFATAVALPVINGIHEIEGVGIASTSGVSARTAAQKYKFDYATSDVKQILNDPTINTVAILTRHQLHAHQVISALEAGKHVFCEKPLALSFEELGEIEKTLSSHSSCILMVGFNRRFAPFIEKIKKFMSGVQEPLVLNYRINAGAIPLDHWVHDPLQGGGRIVGEACHFIDVLTYLTGLLPDKIAASALPNGGRYAGDVAVMSFNYRDGSLGTVSYLSNGDKSYPKERLEVFGGGRIAILDDFRKLELIHNGNRQTLKSALRQDKGHRAEWIAFSKTIIEGGEPPIPYYQLLGVSRAAISAWEEILGKRGQ